MSRNSGIQSGKMRDPNHRSTMKEMHLMRSNVMRLGFLFLMTICINSMVVAQYTTLRPNEWNKRVAKAKKNIVLIMADDMGYSDLGCYGSEIETPNLDRLAQEGLRFKQFYNNAKCCPTHASLLSGLGAQQSGVGPFRNDSGEAYPGYRGFLSKNCVTIAEALKPSGYFSAICGKWHVGHGHVNKWPLQRGFDRFYGHPGPGCIHLSTGNTLLAKMKKRLSFSFLTMALMPVEANLAVAWVLITWLRSAQVTPIIKVEHLGTL